MKYQNTNFYLLSFEFQANQANLATPSSEVQIGNQYDFEITELRAIINGATDITGGLFVDLEISGGVQLNENPVDMFSFSAVNGAIGDGNSGKPISVPWRGAIIPSASKVTAQFTNSSGQTLDFQLIIVGRKIFK